MEKLTYQQACELLDDYGSVNRAQAAERDPLVLAAYEAGVSRHRIFTLTGIARKTVDSIIERANGATGEL